MNKIMDEGNLILFDQAMKNNEEIEEQINSNYKLYTEIFNGNIYFKIHVKDRDTHINLNMAEWTHFFENKGAINAHLEGMEDIMMKNDKATQTDPETPDSSSCKRKKKTAK